MQFRARSFGLIVSGVTLIAMLCGYLLAQLSQSTMDLSAALSATEHWHDTHPYYACSVSTASSDGPLIDQQICCIQENTVRLVIYNSLSDGTTWLTYLSADGGLYAYFPISNRNVVLLRPRDVARLSSFLFPVRNPHTFGSIVGPSTASRTAYGFHLVGTSIATSGWHDYFLGTHLTGPGPTFDLQYAFDGGLRKVLMLSSMGIVQSNITYLSFSKSAVTQMLLDRMQAIPPDTELDLNIDFPRAFRTEQRMASSKRTT
jgi:hypothetical protein